MDCGKSLRDASSYQVQLVDLVFKPARSGSEDGTMAMKDTVGADDANVCMFTGL